MSGLTLGIVVGGNFDDVSTDNLEALKTLKDLLDLLMCNAVRFREPAREVAMC